MISPTIDNRVTSFIKTQGAVNTALEIGQKEGFSPRYIGNMIRERLLAAGVHRSTVARVLPPEAKSNPRGDSSKMLLNQNQNQIQTLSVENYQSEDLDKYPRQFLIKIIRYLEKKQTIKAGVHEIKAIEKEHDYPTKQILTQPTSILS